MTIDIRPAKYGFYEVTKNGQSFKVSSKAHSRETRSAIYKEHDLDLDEIEKLEGVLEPSLDGETILRNPFFVLKSFRDFERMKKDNRYLVKDFLYPQTVNMLYSPPAQFKSITAMHLAMQVSTGKPFMGLKTKKNPVLFCDKENNDQIIKDRLQRLRRGQNIKRKDFPLWFLTRNGDLNDPVFRKELENAIQEHGIKLLVFDTLHRFADYEENRADDINRLYTCVLQPIIDKHDCSIIFLHHTTKEGVYRGSSDLFGMLDTAYSVRRTKQSKNFKLICEKSRFGEIEKLYGMIDFGQDYIKFIRLNEEEKDKESRTKFMEVVKKIGEIFSIKSDSWQRCDVLSEFQILKEKGSLDVSEKTVQRALKWLEKKDYLKKIERGKYARNWEGEFSLWRE